MLFVQSWFSDRRSLDYLLEVVDFPGAKFSHDLNISDPLKSFSGLFIYRSVSRVKMSSRGT